MGDLVYTIWNTVYWELTTDYVNSLVLQILLLMCGDVEENPGPVAMSYQYTDIKALVIGDSMLKYLCSTKRKGNTRRSDFNENFREVRCECVGGVD